MSAYGKITVPTGVNIPQPGQIKNDGGGYSFELNPHSTLIRFLVLGATQGGYYTTAAQNFAVARNAIQKSMAVLRNQFVDTVVEYSVSGRTPKVDTCIYALASAITQKEDPELRFYALSKLHLVCRTPTHLFSLLNDVRSLGGKFGGRAFRKALSAWYTEKNDKILELHMVKYRQRAGWTNGDVLRIAKPAGFSPGSLKGDIFAFATGRTRSVENKDKLWLIDSYERISSGDMRVAEVVKLIQNYGLPWEVLSDKYLKEKSIWKALILPSKAGPGMPIGALVRNLNKITNSCIDDPEVLAHVCARLQDRTALSHARMNPLTLLVACKTYSLGHGEKGSLTWTPNSQVIKALEAAFELSFHYVEKNDKRYCLGLDVSSSMSCGVMQGTTNIRPNEGCGALAKVFHSLGKADIFAFGSDLVDLNKIYPDLFGKRLGAVTSSLSDFNFGSTNPSLVLRKALKDKTFYDAFVIITDNDINAGQHANILFKTYQQEINPNARFVVIALQMNKFTMCDPTNPAMLDFAGFDPAIPQMIAEF